MWSSYKEAIQIIQFSHASPVKWSTWDALWLQVQQSHLSYLDTTKKPIALSINPANIQSKNNY